MGAGTRFQRDTGLGHKPQMCQDEDLYTGSQDICENKDD